MSLESHITDIIEGKKSAPVARALLRVMSQAYRLGVNTRNFAYDAMIPTKRLPLPVVSVGNVVAGGTGKTPFVRYLASAILPYAKVAILSRGYKRKSSKPLLVKSTATPEQVGDEPFLLARRLPMAQVLVGANRALTGYLASILDAEVIILDDGMQYRLLKRDFEIGVMHASDLFGKGYYLPRGFLRDNPKRLKVCDQIILGGVEEEGEFLEVTDQIRRYTDAPITAMELIVENSTQLTSKKVASFCAIASPRRFQKTLQKLGCDVVKTQEKPDHDPFYEEELQCFANQAKAEGAECLVCTEKDLVKLPREVRLSLPIIPVKISLSPKFGKNHLETLIQRIIEVS